MAHKTTLPSRKKSNSKNSKYRRKIESNFIHFITGFYSGSNVKTLIWLYSIIGIYYIKYHFSYKIPYKRQKYAHPYDHSFVPRVHPVQNVNQNQNQQNSNQTYQSKHQVSLDGNNNNQNPQNKQFTVHTTQITTTARTRPLEIENGLRKIVVTSGENTQAEFAAKILLNKHPKLFYLHEPLFLTQFRDDKKGSDYSKKILEEYRK